MLKLEVAGSGQHLGMIRASPEMYCSTFCFVDLQHTVSAYISELEDDHATKFKVDAKQLRLFAGHGGAELTAIGCSANYNNLRNWLLALKEKASTDSSAFFVLSVSIYDLLSIVEVELAHGWSCLWEEPLARVNKRAVLAAVAVDPLVLRYACPELRDDPEVVLAAVARDPRAFLYASSSLKKNKQFVLQILDVDPNLLKYVDLSLRDDLEVVTAAVQREGNCVLFASSKLKGQQSLCKLALKTSSSINVLYAASFDLWFLHEERRTNERLAREALAKPMQGATRAFVVSVAATRQLRRELWRPWISLKNAHDSWKQDEDIVMLAIKEDMLLYADASLIQDKSFVLKAVSVCGTSLKNLPSFHSDKDVVLAAIAQNTDALVYAKASLTECSEYALAAIAVVKEQYVSRLFGKALKKNKEVVMAAVKRYGPALQYAHSSLRKNREVVLAAIRQDEHALQYAHKSLLSIEDFCLEALATHAGKFDADYVTPFLGKSLQCNEAIVKAVLKVVPGAFLSCKLKTQHMANYICSCHGYRALAFIPKEFQLQIEPAVFAAIETEAPNINVCASYTSLCDAHKLAQHYVACCIHKNIPLQVVVSETQKCTSYILCARIMNQISLLYHDS